MKIWILNLYFVVTLATVSCDREAKQTTFENSASVVKVRSDIAKYYFDLYGTTLGTVSTNLENVFDRYYNTYWRRLRQMLRRHPTAGDDANMKLKHAEVSAYFTTMKDQMSTTITDLVTQSASLYSGIDTKLKAEAKKVSKTYTDNFSSTTLTCVSKSESTFRDAISSSYVNLRSCAIKESRSGSSVTQEFTKTMKAFRQTMQTVLTEFRKCNAKKTDQLAIDCTLANVYTIPYKDQLTDFETKLADFNINNLATCCNTVETEALTKLTTVLTDIESCLQISTTTAAPDTTTEAPTTMMPS